MQTSWFRKIWKGHSKGVSTVIGTVFLMLIIFMVATNVILWTFLKNAEYNQAVMDRNEEEASRSTEKITMRDVSYDAEDGQVRVEGSVTNEGPVPVQITTFWVLDEISRKHGYNDMVDINLKAGDTFNFTESEALIVAVEGLEDNSSTAFTSWFVTARGNLVPLEEEQKWIQYNYNYTIINGTGSSMPKVIIGSLMLDLETFRYFPYATSNKLSNYPTGIRGYDVPAGTEMAFGCLVTNVDPANRSIVLDSHSLLWFTMPSSDVPHNTWWYIVNADGGTVSSTYSEITLSHGETELIVFASANDAGDSSFSKQITPNKSASVSVFLLFHGSIGNKTARAPWGQNIPFVSVYVEP